MKKMTIRVMTPDKVILEQDATQIRVFGEQNGRFAILPEHAPMITSLDHCELKIENNNAAPVYLAVDSALVETSTNQVSVLAQIAAITDKEDTALSKLAAKIKKRKKQNQKSREQGIKTEMELYRLLREANQGHVR